MRLFILKIKKKFHSILSPRRNASHLFYQIDAGEDVGEKVRAKNKFIMAIHSGQHMRALNENYFFALAYFGPIL